MPTKKTSNIPAPTPREAFAELLAPPADLGPVARAWWDDVRTTFDIRDAEGLTVLRLGACALDRAERCRAAISRDGESVLGRDGQVRAHPLIAAERDARAGALAALKRLDIGTTEPARVGRPAGAR